MENLQQSQKERSPPKKIRQLDLKETANLCGWHFWCGVKDALAWPSSLIIIYGSTTIRNRALKCFILNGVIFLGSIFFFNHITLPILHALFRITFFSSRISSSETIEDTAELTITTKSKPFLDSFVILAYQLLWVYPIFLLSFVLNAMWYQQIADRAYTLQYDKPPNLKLTYNRFLMQLADEIYRAFLFMNYLCVSTLVYLVPFIGPLISFMLICWIYAFYSFEYKWINKGWNLEQRINYFEERWAYFAGFGFLFTLVTFFVNQFLSASIFAMAFPIYIIMANNALPMPRQNESARFSPYMPYRIRIFWVARKLNDMIIGCLPR
ncbi:hypothetical protein G9A89_022077 [Geosiphon pyriformis]|nr:hypothetical protein G9A89_022077 [Geosiphon pyriformis]